MEASGRIRNGRLAKGSGDSHVVMKGLRTQLLGFKAVWAASQVSKDWGPRPASASQDA